MKIMCVIGAFSFGGAEHVMTNLVNYFNKTDEVIYISLFHRDSPAYPIDEGVCIINGVGFSKKLSAVGMLRKIIKEQKPDIILSFMTQINNLTIMATLATGIPIVVSERADPKRTPGILNKLLRWVFYRFADGFVFQTNDAKGYFSKTIQEKSEVIPNPIFVSTEDLSFVSKKRDHVIVSVGRLEDQKNFPLLITAFSRVSDEYPDYELHIYGDGSKKEQLETLAQKLNIMNKVRFCGTHRDLHTRIRNASLFILPSDFEGMPNSLMEAMALGMCCISTDCPVGGPKELIDNGENGFLIPVGYVDQLESTMRKLLKNQDLIRTTGEKAKEIMIRLNPDKISERWKTFLNKICGVNK